MKVSALLESMPGVGKVRAKQIMERLGIAESRRVRGPGARTASGSRWSSESAAGLSGAAEAAKRRRRGGGRRSVADPRLIARRRAPDPGPSRPG